MDSATDSDEYLFDAAVHVIFGPASPRSHGGSLPGRANNIDSNHEAHAASLLQDYILPDCTYDEDHFQDHVVPIAAVGDLLLGKLDALDFVGLVHLGATLTLLVDESIVALE